MDVSVIRNAIYNGVSGTGVSESIRQIRSSILPRFSPTQSISIAEDPKLNESISPFHRMPLNNIPMHSLDVYQSLGNSHFLNDVFARTTSVAAYESSLALIRSSKHLLSGIDTTA